MLGMVTGSRKQVALMLTLARRLLPINQSSTPQVNVHDLTLHSTERTPTTVNLLLATIMAPTTVVIIIMGTTTTNLPSWFKKTFYNTQCTGSYKVASYYLNCVIIDYNTSQLPDSNQYYCKTCFHKDTEISYEGQTYTLEEFQKSSNSHVCAVPHVVKTDGVIIRTSCPKSRPLRLTADHLVYTQKGLVEAQSVMVGDQLFADIDSSVSCPVISVGSEQNQEYFGLNCENSVVLADGYKTSTFGIYHNVPALWMKIGSKVLGVQRASQFGDVLARFFYYVIPH